MVDEELVDVSHVSRRGSSLRMTLPKRVVEKLGAENGDIIGFYQKDSKIILLKLK